METSSRRRDGDRARFEQEVLSVVRRWLLSGKVATPQVFHRIELDGQYPDTEIVIEYTTQTNPTAQTDRYAIWGPLFAGEDDPESVGVLIMTWAMGG